MEQFFTNSPSKDAENKFVSREELSVPLKWAAKISPVPLQLAGEHSHQPPLEQSETRKHLPWDQSVMLASDPGACPAEQGGLSSLIS